MIEKLSSSMDKEESSSLVPFIIQEAPLK